MGPATPSHTVLSHLSQCSEISSIYHPPFIVHVSLALGSLRASKQRPSFLPRGPISGGGPARCRSGQLGRVPGGNSQAGPKTDGSIWTSWPLGQDVKAAHYININTLLILNSSSYSRLLRLDRNRYATSQIIDTIHSNSVRIQYNLIYSR